MSKHSELPEYLKKFLLEIETEISSENHKIYKTTENSIEQGESLDEPPAYPCGKLDCQMDQKLETNSVDSQQASDLEEEVQDTADSESDLQVSHDHASDIAESHQTPESMKFDDLADIIQHKEGSIVRTSRYSVINQILLYNTFISLRHLISFLKEFCFIFCIKKLQTEVISSESSETLRKNKDLTKMDSLLNNNNDPPEDMLSENADKDNEPLEKSTFDSIKNEFEKMKESIMTDLENVKKDLLSYQKAIQNMNLLSEKLEKAAQEQKKTLENLLQGFVKIQEDKQSQQKLLEQIQEQTNRNIESLFEKFENQRKAQIQKISESLKTFEEQVFLKQKDFENNINEQLRATNRRFEDEKITLKELLNSFNQKFQELQKNLSENSETVKQLGEKISDMDEKIEGLEEEINEKNICTIGQALQGKPSVVTNPSESLKENLNEKSNERLNPVSDSKDDRQLLSEEKIRTILKVVRMGGNKKKVMILRKKNQQSQSIMN